MVIPLDRVYLGNYFYYDESSPSGLRWAVNKGTRAKKDAVAGSLKPDGYWQVVLDSITYKVHRVIWALQKEDPANLVINHKDNTTNNNIISNLEACTSHENSQRMKVHTGTGLYTSNFSGQNRISERNIGGYYYAVAYWQENKAQKSKTFSYKKYGILEAGAMAYKYRKERETEK